MCARVYVHESKHKDVTNYSPFLSLSLSLSLYLPLSPSLSLSPSLFLSLSLSLQNQIYGILSDKAIVDRELGEKSSYIKFY